MVCLLEAEVEIPKKYAKLAAEKTKLMKALVTFATMNLATMPVVDAMIPSDVPKINKHTLSCKVSENKNNLPFRSIFQSIPR